MTTKKYQITPEVDAGQAIENFGRLERAGKKAGEGIAQAGQTGSRGVEAIAGATDRSTKATEAAASRMVASVERAMARLQSTTQGDVFGDLARQRGLDGNPRVQAAIEKYQELERAKAAAAATELFERESNAARALARSAEYVGFWVGALEKKEAAEKAAAASALFEREHEAARKLNADAQYVAFWSQALEQKDAAEKANAANALFEREHQEARKLNADAEYVRFWTQALEQKESQEKEAAGAALFEREHQAARKLAKDAEYVAFWTAELDKKEAAERRSAASDAFIGQLRQQAGAIGKTRADLLELKAAELGVAEAAAPMIAALRAQERSLGIVGNSAKQNKAALQQVPAQVTDIVTSLAAGQNPMLVLLQQGGQLKDQFGGVGAAARGIGGYIAGLINPVTLLAAGAAAVGAGFALGYVEAAKLRAELIQTGSVAGKTEAQARAIVESVVRSTGATRGTVSEVVAELAKVAELRAGDIDRFTAAALRMQAAGGPAATETAKAFASLADKPLEAATELNKSVNFLTASTYSQIKALADQGRSTDAARVAQEAFFNALNARTPQMLANVGYLEKAWKQFANEVRAALNLVTSIGAPETLPQQAGIAEAKLNEAQRRLDFARNGPQKDQTLLIQGLEAEVKTRSDALAAIRRTEQAERQDADAKSRNAAATRLRVEAEKALTNALDDSEKRQQRRVQAKNLFDQGAFSKAEYDKVIASINAEEKKAPRARGGSPFAGQDQLAELRARVADSARYVEALREQGLEADKATQSERELLKVAERFKGPMDAKTRSLLTQQLSLLAAAATNERYAETLKDQLREEERAAKERERVAREAADAFQRVNEQLAGENANYIDSLLAQGDAVAQAARKQEAANSVYGKGKSAVEEMTLSLLRQKLALVGFDDNARRILEQTIKDQEALVAATRSAEFKPIALKNEEALRAANDAFALQQDEFALLGLSNAEREQANALRAISLKLAAAEAEIERSTGSEAEKRLAIENARLAAGVERMNVMSKSVQKQWTEVGDAIRGSFESAFAAVATGSKTGKEAFRDFANAIINEMVRIAAQNLAKSIFGGATGSGSESGWLGSILQLISGLGGSTTVTGATGDFARLDRLATPMSTGTNYVPRDMLAYVHQGEAVVPKAYNPVAGGQKAADGDIYITNNSGANVRAERDSAGDVQIVIDEAVRRAENRIAGQIASGNGAVATAMRSRGIGMNGGMLRRA